MEQLDLIGLTTWTEHPRLIPGIKKPTLTEYSRVFPVVELDTFFYGLKDVKIVAHWQTQVSPQFQFIIKPPRELTLHEAPAAGVSLAQIYQQFLATIRPLQERGQLAGVLMQFSPNFGLAGSSLDYLAFVRKHLPRLPIMIEFRHRSWYDPRYFDQVVGRLRALQLTLAMIDQPDIGADSVPLRPVVTTPQLGFWRFHGRNGVNWAKKGFGGKVGRTLYHYSETELQELAALVKEFSPQVAHNYIIFNNNSGGDASENALQFSQALGLNYQRAGGQQLDLFE
ncbi:DUF72 domain-containing protein [Lapidilactobacillus achengensis]|uniref:DUF72 domain-containing protein n=1 Tax=Lapidilactobacillus achengensis TaxID=2486000 RepID=A0ABW1UR50_9LACO|nr:DUF72 domain-containing protein [Lapidilactobacillus achengensis]